MDSNLLEAMGSKLVLTTEEGNVVRIPDDVWQSSVVNYDQCLVGRVLLRKRCLVFGIWSKVLSFKKIGNDRFLIHFGNNQEMKRTFRRGPWSFDKNLVILRQIPKGMEPTSVDMDISDFHVHITRLPCGFANQSITRIIGQALGGFVEFQENEEKKIVSNTMRFRVSISILKGLFFDFFVLKVRRRQRFKFLSLMRNSLISVTTVGL